MAISRSAGGMAVFCGTYLAVLLFALHPQTFSAAAEDQRMTAAWPLQTEGWSWDKAALDYTPANLYDHINGAAEVFLAYNFQHATVRRYDKPGHPSIVAEIYLMGSSEDAYGVFSLDRQDPDAGIGQGSEFGGGMLRFWKDRYFVTVLAEAEGAGVEEAIITLGRGIADAILKEGKLPVLLEYLPGGPGILLNREVFFVRNHILLNRRFFVAQQNILKLDRLSGAVVAPYRNDKTKVYLFVIRYASEQAAAEALGSFAGAYMPENRGADPVRTEDDTWTHTSRFREYLVIAFGAPSAGQARALAEGALTRLEARHK